MASKKSSSGSRLHYDYAVTGNVPGVGSLSSKSTTAPRQNYKHGGHAKKKGRR